VAMLSFVGAGLTNTDGEEMSEKNLTVTLTVSEAAEAEYALFLYLQESAKLLRKQTKSGDKGGARLTEYEMERVQRVADIFHDAISRSEIRAAVYGE
jgi:hypothetical protein